MDLSSMRLVHDFCRPHAFIWGLTNYRTSFLAPCQRITEYYIETRYPIGIHTLLQPETVQADLKTTRTLSELIRDKVFPRQS
jgi:hypothetical protein